jgi:uncharacterized radical SAM superfamily protein
MYLAGTVRRSKMSEVNGLKEKCMSYPLDELMQEARTISWEHFGKKIELYYSYYQSKADETQITKDVKEKYQNGFIKSIKDSLVDVTPIISLSGNRCELMCEHCKKINLMGMHKATTPDELYGSIRTFCENGSCGFLLSAGSRKTGETIIGPEFDDMIKKIKAEFDVYIGIHVGYISRERVGDFKQLGVDSLLIDVIGCEKTLKDVYHVNRPLSVIDDTLSYIFDQKIDVIPHICIGLHYGQIIGEYDAVDMLSKYPVKYVTYVILQPTPGTPMANVNPPTQEEVTRVLSYSRLRLPKALTSLGCIRPIGRYGEIMEEMAIKAGCNRIAGISSEKTLETCQHFGLQYNMASHCCMIGNGLFE